MHLNKNKKKSLIKLNHDIMLIKNFNANSNLSCLYRLIIH
jgi:hypothetical protein